MHSVVGLKGLASEGNCSVLCNTWLKRQNRETGLAIWFDGGNAVGNGHSKLDLLRP